LLPLQSKANIKSNLMRLALLIGMLCIAVLSVQSQPRPSYKSKDQAAVTLSDSLTGNPEEKLELRGKVEISKGAVKLVAPEVDYDVISDTALARGGVVFQQGKDVIRAPELKINLNTNAGSAPLPEFFYAQHNGRGNAKTLLMSENRLQTLNEVNYTSCKPDQNDWMLTADTLTLDNATQTGVAKGAVVRFFDIPIFALPHFEFALGNEKRSGFLTPALGYNTVSGVSVSAPYYFNLAHNYDLTLTARYMTRRGFQLTSNARYLTAHLSGDSRIDWLPKDDLLGLKRWGTFTHHTYTNGNWSLGLNAERVSDNTFFADLTKTLNTAAQTSLPTELWSRYQASWGEMNARASQYQTLQDASNSIIPAYARLPVVNLTLKPIVWKHLKFDLQAQTAKFKHETLTQGQRSYAIPQVRTDYRNEWGFFTTKLALNSAQYSGLNSLSYTGSSSYSRALPIASLDTGLVFERSASWFGKTAMQTLEPRLYYVYVPYKDQANVPLFDTALSGFGFSQIFSDNVFTGQDRIADANHVTPALTSRWADSQSGVELFKATLGKRYYFKPQRVQLTGPSLPVSSELGGTSSDWLFAAAGQITQQISLDTALQYNATNKEIVNSAHTLRYNPSQRQLVSASKRFTKGTQNAVDLSWQWKTTPNSAVMGRLAYSLGVVSANLAKGATESLLGYEYDAGCWVFRVAANRYKTTANTKSTSIVMQLDLSGLTQVGSGSLETLKRNIPGYLPFESKPTWTYDAFRPF
jgi:LPS-assembly protein